MTYTDWVCEYPEEFLLYTLFGYMLGTVLF